MSLMMESQTMARPKGRPKRSEREDVTVKIDRTVAIRAKTVANFRGVSLAELLSDLLDAPVMQAYADMVREMPPGGSARPAPPKKGGGK
jgi:hypothetical protein